jgi:hypothetical protein|tara:strand:- start:698 stop:850 length:153 start_codon:yes stop_codon:yes gene_type:complete
LHLQVQHLRLLEAVEVDLMLVLQKDQPLVKVAEVPVEQEEVVHHHMEVLD